jgi:hypothetical protein
MSFLSFQKYQPLEGNVPDDPGTRLDGLTTTALDAAVFVVPAVMTPRIIAITAIPANVYLFI